MKATIFSLLIIFLSTPLLAADQPEPPATLNEPPATAEHLDSGLITLVLEEGTGTAHPTETDILKVDYTVWKSDGTLVAQVPGDRSVAVPVFEMLPGWREAAEMMVVGETRRAWVPSELGGGKIPEGEHFLFDTRLVDIVPFPRTPENLSEPPAGATRTDSGLAYEILEPGKGTEHPSRWSEVVVDYTGWTTDGKMFDSSVIRGVPATFSLRGVIRGWTEGLQLMTVGEKTRFWIPAKLAYGNEKGKPQGMLVFDIELLEIK